MRQLGYSMFGAAALMAVAGSAIATVLTLGHSFLGHMSPRLFRSAVRSRPASSTTSSRILQLVSHRWQLHRSAGQLQHLLPQLEQVVEDGNVYNYEESAQPTPSRAHAPPFQFPLGALGNDRYPDSLAASTAASRRGSAIDCASFQLSVWAIVYDANLVLNEPGDFYQLRDSRQLPGHRPHLHRRVQPSSVLPQLHQRSRAQGSARGLAQPQRSGPGNPDARHAVPPWFRRFGHRPSSPPLIDIPFAILQPAAPIGVAGCLFDREHRDDGAITPGKNVE